MMFQDAVSLDNLLFAILLTSALIALILGVLLTIFEDQ